MLNIIKNGGVGVKLKNRLEKKIGIKVMINRMK